MRLYAVSDLHVGDPKNREALATITPHPEDWLILAGDLGETFQHVRYVFETLAPRFQRLVWVPGNHELWCVRPDEPRGQERYERLVELCREYGVLSPEDPYPIWEGKGGRCAIAPMFLLYDYSFGPAGFTPEQSVAWAVEQDILCVDEHYLQHAPFASRQAWCEERCRLTEARLSALPADVETVLINHFPLRREHAVTPRVPRFTIWCGTEKTHDWHIRYRARVVVSGHLHMRSTRWLDGVRFEEVSLGYSRDWSRERGVDAYLREILA